jgi:putative glutamine amidotransferase
MQMLNHYLGGGLVRVNGHVATQHLLEGDWARQQGYELVNSYHKQAITSQTVAQSLEVLAMAADGAVEAVKHSTLPWLGIMWHPEREAVVSKSDQELILKFFGFK